MNGRVGQDKKKGEYTYIGANRLCSGIKNIFQSHYLLGVELRTESNINTIFDKVIDKSSTVCQIKRHGVT